MSINLKIFLFIFVIILTIITTNILKKGRIPAKYSLLWYFISLIVLVVAIFPKPVEYIANLLGVQVLSNLVIAMFLCLLIFLTLTLTIIVSGQKKKITLLIQELSILRNEINEKK